MSAVANTAEFRRELLLDDGSHAVIRPIRPEDEPLMVHFHESLSEDSVYFRYFSPLKLEQRISHQRLLRVCHPDYAHDIALVLDRERPGSGEREILGVVRLVRNDPGDAAEYAIILTDRWHRHGLASELTRAILELARAERIRVIRAYILPENRAMLRLARRFGFEVRTLPSGESVAELRLE